jgi:hypothetical protein
MKNTILILLIIIIGCILATGCVGQIKQINATSNTTTVTPTNTFIPFPNETNISYSTVVPEETVTSGLKGSLRISIGGWDADLPAYVDNKSVGIVTKNKPLDVMLNEGTHTVKVCTGIMCEEENVTVRFAKQNHVDFEERLIRDVEFPKPTARIIGYNPSGDTITVNVEFINPSAKDLYMTADVRCAYTYIDSRDARTGSMATGMVGAEVISGSRVREDVDLGLAYGYSYVYSVPIISGITSR